MEEEDFISVSEGKCDSLLWKQDKNPTTESETFQFVTKVFSEICSVTPDFGQSQSSLRTVVVNITCVQQPAGVWASIDRLTSAVLSGSSATRFPEDSWTSQGASDLRQASPEHRAPQPLYSLGGASPHRCTASQVTRLHLTD